MNSKNNYFIIICFGVLLLAISQKLSAISVNELADISEAMESTIHDVYVEYEWYNDPPSTQEDVAGTGNIMAKERPKYKWTTARPFAELSLTTESVIFMNEYGDSWHGISRQSYNGKVGKYLSLIDRLDGGHPKMSGTLTKEKRFMPPRRLTPEGFTILRFHDDLPISERLRQKNTVVLDLGIKTVNSFNCIRTEFLIPTLLPGKKVPYLRIYFSIDHSYTPVKFESINAGKTSTCVEVTELEEVSEGLWYPKSGRMGSPQDKRYNVYEASKIIVNQGLTDKDFDLEFPPGTKIYDEITDLEYVIRPTEEQFNKWLENQENLRTMSKARKKTDQPTKTCSQSPETDDQSNSSEVSNNVDKSVLVKKPQMQKNKPTRHILIYILLAILISVVVILILKSLLTKGNSHEQN